MSDLASTNWSETDSSNAASPPNGWPENMNPSDVNDAARANMGALKRWYDHINPTATTGGTTTAYTLSYTVAPAQLWGSEAYCCIINATCGAAPTLNINSLGAKNLRKFSAGVWANCAASDLPANCVIGFYYNSVATTYDIFFVSSSPTDFVALAVANIFTATQTLSGAALNLAKGADVPSATTTDIGAATGNFVHVTGTTTITGLGTIQAGTGRLVEFTGALTLTHDGTALILPGAANITTAAGDIALFVSEGSGNWRCAYYQKAAGVPVSLTPITNSLSGDVAMNSTATYFDGPSIAQGTAGTWFVSGSVVVDYQNGNSVVDAKLWDGTTVIASTQQQGSSNTPTRMNIALSGRISSPAANLRISVRNETVATGSILFNASGNSKDSTITAIRIA